MDVKENYLRFIDSIKMNGNFSELFDVSSVWLIFTELKIYSSHKLNILFTLMKDKLMDIKRALGYSF